LLVDYSLLTRPSRRSVRGDSGEALARRRQAPLPPTSPVAAAAAGRPRGGGRRPHHQRCWEEARRGGGGRASRWSGGATLRVQSGVRGLRHAGLRQWWSGAVVATSSGLLMLLGSGRADLQRYGAGGAMQDWVRQVWCCGEAGVACSGEAFVAAPARAQA
jgi:hypothetical protein